MDLLTQQSTPVPRANRIAALEVEGVPGHCIDPSTESDGNLTDAVSAPTSNSSEIINVIAGTEHELLLIDGKIEGHRAMFLVDSASTHDFISENFVERLRIQTNQSSDNLHVTLADGATSHRPLRLTGNLKLNFGGRGETQVLTIFPLRRYDAILGKPW